MVVAAGAMVGLVVARALFRYAVSIVHAHAGAAATRFRFVVLVVVSSVAAGAAVAARTPVDAAWPAFVVLAAAAPTLAWLDVAAGRLPLPMTGALLMLTAGCVAFATWAGQLSVAELGRGLAAAALVGGVTLALTFLLPAHLGTGDAALAAVLGLHAAWWGWATLAVALGVGLVAAGATALAMWLAKRAVSTVPWRSLLLAGWLTVVLIG